MGQSGSFGRVFGSQKRRAVVAMLVPAMLAGGALSGCSNMNEGDKTRAQGTGIGAGAGALIGGIIGYAAGGEDRGKGALIGAAIGAGVGGTAGYFYGDAVAKKKEKYAREEDFLRDEVASARQRREAAERENQRLTEEIAQLRTQRQQLGQSNTDTAAERKKIEEQIAAEQKGVEQQIAYSREVLNQTSDSDPQSQQLEQEITQLNGQLENLKRHREELARI
jgi:phage tail tape-measure protein